LASASAAAFPTNLGWAHYRVLLKVTNDNARAFYEIEAAREGWSSRELERQVGSLLFERLARSRDKQKVLAQARRGAQPESPADVIKEPFVLEFLGLDERAAWRERDLEQAIEPLNLYEIIRKRYRHGATTITSTATSGSVPRCSGTRGSRAPAWAQLLHNAHVVVVNGDIYRNPPAGQESAPRQRPA
jgi:hypothetical protein